MTNSMLSAILLLWTVNLSLSSYFDNEFIQIILLEKNTLMSNNDSLCSWLMHCVWRSD